MTQKMCHSPTLELAKGSITNTRAVYVAVKGRWGDIAVTISSTSLENVQTKMSKKLMMQVNIRVKKDKYMSTLRARTDTKIQGVYFSRNLCL